MEATIILNSPIKDPNPARTPQNRKTPAIKEQYHF